MFRPLPFNSPAQTPPLPRGCPLFPLPHSSQASHLRVVADLSEYTCLYQGTHLQPPRLTQWGVGDYPHTAQRPLTPFQEVFFSAEGAQFLRIV